jgi:hypothetical protein
MTEPAEHPARPRPIHPSYRRALEDPDTYLHLVRNSALVFASILEERRLQDEQHGGPDTDDRKTRDDWCNLLELYLDRARQRPATEFGWRLKEIAALAVAAMESVARHQPDFIHELYAWEQVNRLYELDAKGRRRLRVVRGGR